MTTPNSSNLGKPTSHQICMIYDPADGRVAHTHEALTYPGGSELTASSVEAEALAVLARGMRTDVSGLRSLHVQPSEYQRGTRYRIELPSRRLIAGSPEK